MDVPTAVANAGAKAHDRVAVSVGKAFDGADADAFTKGSDDFDLLFNR